MNEFSRLPNTEPLQKVIKAAFDTDIDIDGGWGYDETAPLHIRTLSEGILREQMQHMLASMRTYLEMHLTLPKEKRYGSINLNEVKRERFERNGRKLECVTYRAEAMKESDYEAFIEEYKQGYGKSDFDLNDHFQRRKEATITRTVTLWFDISDIL
jgi:hypothetical protein